MTTKFLLASKNKMAISKYDVLCCGLQFIECCCDKYMLSYLHFLNDSLIQFQVVGRWKVVLDVYILFLYFFIMIYKNLT